MWYNNIHKQSRFATEKAATLAALIALIRESALESNAMKMSPPKQPDTEIRFGIAMFGFIFPIFIMMSCHILGIVVSTDFRQAMTHISLSFMAMLGFEELILFYNIFFIIKPIEKHIKPPSPPKPIIIKSRNRSGFVYLLATPHDVTLFKIGRTSNPDNRLRTFNVKLPFPVEYTHLIKTDDMYTLESALHRRFASQRLNGEFFRLTEADVQYIKALSK